MALALPRRSAFPLAGWLRIGARLALMIGWFVVCLPLYYLAVPFARRNPVPRWFLRGIVDIAGIAIEVSGTRVRRGAFLLANHVSWIDIPALAAVSGTTFVGHDGLSSVPMLKWLCAMNRTVFVARHDRAGVADQIAEVRAAVSDRGTLTIFPEGTTADGSELLAFKSSLLSALEPPPVGIAIQPVALDYGREAGSIAWIGEESGIDNFLRILARRRPVRLTIRFLPPLESTALASRKTIAATARAAIQAALRAVR